MVNIPINTITLLPWSISSPSVGHSVRAMGTCGGTYASGAMPDASNAGAQTSGRERPSGFVKRKVRTSFGFASSQVLTVAR